MNKKENKGKNKDIVNTPITIKQNKTFTKSKNKKQNKFAKPLIKSSNNRIDSESNKHSHQSTQTQIHLKQIINFLNSFIRKKLRNKIFLNK